jgi:iron complex outermembrane receptor protein
MIKLADAVIFATVLLSLGAQAEGNASGSSASASDSALSEIVVTAQRRPESLQTVPVSVTALTSDTLESRNINDLQQITLAAPSLQIGGDNTFSIRGAGTLAFAQTLDSSVATSVDEVSLGRTFLNGALFNDVAQVEVLNGPQGLLFGKNASAGLLNIVTTRPKLNTFEGSTDVEYDYHDTTPGGGSGFIARGTVNLPLGETSALRINVDDALQPPVARYEGGGSMRVDQDARNYGVRAKYLYEPSDNFNLYLIGEFHEELGVAGVFDRTWRQLGPNSINTDAVAADHITPSPDNLRYAIDGEAYRDLHAAGLQGKVTYVLPNGFELSDIAAWKSYGLNQQIDIDYTSSNGVDLNSATIHYHQFSNELRLAIPASQRVNGQIGLYFFDLHQDDANYLGGNIYFPSFLLPTFPFCVGATVAAGGPPNCSVSNRFFLGSDENSTLTNRSYALFGQFNFRLTDALQFIAGARGTYDRVGIDLIQGQVPYFVALGPSGTFSDRDSNTNFSWKLGVQYQLSSDAMAYATYGRGYKAPGFNESATNPTASLLVRPETNDAAEVGFKSTWFDRRLIFDVALFHSKFTDYQVQSFDTTLQTFIIQNAASLTSQGAEITVIARPVQRLTLNATATILDAKFNNFEGAQCYPGQPNCSSAGTFNARGLRTPLAPRLTSSIEAIYTFPISGHVDGLFEVNDYYRSALNYSINNAPGTAVGGTNLLGASAGVQSSDGWRFTLFCHNCANKVTPTNIGPDAGDASSGIASYIQAWGPNSVRTVGLTAAYKF